VTTRFIRRVDCPKGDLDAIATPKASGEPTSAVETIVTRIYERCGEKEGFPAAIAGCIIREEEQNFGRQLEARYKELITHQDKEWVGTLRTSQRAWLQYQKKPLFA
jgi:uncharacterized protein YecT (DUF1311 family)